MIILNYQQCAVKDGMMRFPEKLNLDKIYVGDLDIAHVRIFPGKKKYKVEVVYKVEALPKRKKGNIAGIDLGLDNLATVAINKRGIRPLLINGRPLKSMNLYFNNKRDKVQSELKNATIDICRISLKHYIANVIIVLIHICIKRLKKLSIIV